MNKKLTVSVVALLTIGFIIGIGYGCVFRNIWGISCPSCGLSKAWLALLHGNIAEAFSIHPMFFFAPMLMLYCCKNRPIISRHVDIAILSLLGIAYIVLYFIKLFT